MVVTAATSRSNRLDSHLKKLMPLNLSFLQIMFKQSVSCHWWCYLKHSWHIQWYLTIAEAQFLAPQYKTQPSVLLNIMDEMYVNVETLSGTLSNRTSKKKGSENIYENVIELNRTGPALQGNEHKETDTDTQNYFSVTCANKKLN